MPDYDTYNMSLKEKVFYTLAASVLIFSMSYIFYRSYVLSLIPVPLALLYPRIKKRRIIAKRKKELNIQFKDMLYSLSSSLSAGRTVEGAFRDVLKDLAVIYPEPSTFILAEVRAIVKRLEMNDSLENALADFAHRARLEDVDNFVSVFNICKRSGGNITEVIKNTSAIINDKIETGQEIDTMLAQRKFEQKVLNAVPVLMILFLSASAPEYMNPVFTTMTGRVTMTVSIALMAAAAFISAKICDIKF